MPAGKSGNADSGGNKTVNRETFRPPWVKEGMEGLPPKPSNLSTKPKQIKEVPPAEPPKDTRPSWVKNRRSSTEDGDSESPIAGLKKTSVKTSQSQSQENGSTKENTFVRPQLKKVPPKEQTKLQSNEVKIPIKLNSVTDRPPLNRTKTINKEDMDIDKVIPQERNAIVRQESLKKIPPKAPPMPPPAPAFPRTTDLKSLSDKQMRVIELLKARPKVRPDWTAMLKEVESGRKLKHVECNDRSKPLLTKTKEQSQFIYESEKKEKDTSHNQLLKQIQQGVALRKTKTSDRSKPMLEGLRKFRRQMTIEEQIIKSQSMASIPPEEIADEADELDDIDKVRDDLQSTKQMLALELRNKEALNRDTKRYQARIAQLEAELEKEIKSKKSDAPQPTDANEKLVTSLKSEAAEARKTAEELEKKFHDAADQLDHTKTELEEVRRQKQLLEKKLQESPQNKRMSISDRKESVAKQSESEEEFEEIEPESEGSDNEEKRDRRTQRELKQFRNKLRNYINKEDNAKQERVALKRQIKQLQLAMKDEKKKYKTLQKEVKKMEAMMREVGDDSDEEEPEKEESETEETETETESSETESETDDSESEPEDAPAEKKKDNLTERVKKHEGRLSALKKGNYMLKANVERLQDDLNKQKEDSVTLQQDLDSVLAELD